MKSKRKAEAPKADNWPKAWGSNREAYWEQITGKPWDEETASYKQLLKVIDEQAAAFKPEGRDPKCFGLAYDKQDELCNEHCPHMPLCARICETKPELAKLLEETETALKEADGVDPEEAQALFPKEKGSERFAWSGRVSDYAESLSDSDEDRALLSLLQWMKLRGRKGFTAKDVLGFVMENFGYEKKSEGQEFVDSILEHLRESGNVKEAA